MSLPPDDPLLKLRLAPAESAAELAHKFNREKRAVQLQRETRLTEDPRKFRIGSVPYLNAVPITRGLEESITIAPPSQLARMLEADELDAALVSVVEVLLKDRYDVLNGVGVASLGEVRSVFLAHTRPIEEIHTVHCDTASLTSVCLLKVLLAERGLSPQFKPLPNWDLASMPESVLLIGDPAIKFALEQQTHEIWDLGAAWCELTRLPFVYAVWALKRGIENSDLRRQLREARDFGMDTLDQIIASRSEFDPAFRQDYLGWHIHYHIGGDELRGIATFMELLVKHGLGPVFQPSWVS